MKVLKSKKILYTGSILILLIILFIIVLHVHKSGKSVDYPEINLIGSENIYIEVNDEFSDPGCEAYDKKDGDLTSKIEKLGTVDNKNPGIYEIEYKITNSNKKTVSTKRLVHVKASAKPEYKEDYDSIDNTTQGWGLKYNEVGMRPDLRITKEELLKYNAYAVGPEEKVIYLTFDEGTIKSYLPDIVKILNKYDIKGTFFLCMKYIKNNSDLIKEMVKNGHSIGNHTATHPSMPSLATKDNFSSFLEELSKTNDEYRKIIGKNMDKIYREPRGEFSLRTLSIMKDLGYKTYFWSAAYKDWDDSLSKGQALDYMKKRLHLGAIYLLHPTSKANYRALEDFIKYAKGEGYTFDLVKNI